MPAGWCRLLLSFHLIEKIGVKDLFTWTFPAITPELEQYILNAINREQIENRKNVCLKRTTNTWLYIVPFVNQSINYFILITQEFHPKRYKFICDRFIDLFLKNDQNPVELVRFFVDLQTSDVISCNRNFSSGIKKLIQFFDLEIILIFTVILLKRRSFIYHPDVERLQTALYTIGSLVPTRNPNEYIYPLVRTIKEIKGPSFFVAGITSKTLLNDCPNLYDVWVDLETGQIEVMSHSKESMSMTKIHKELAIFLTQISKTDDTVPEHEIRQKTLEKIEHIIENLKDLATVEGMVTLDDIKGRKFSKGIENFLVHLALAENLLIL